MMAPNGSRKGQIWHDFSLFSERMYKVARTGTNFMDYSQEYNTGDIPSELLQFAHRLARDCTIPGTYLIQYTIPDHPARPRQVVITKTETIRTFHVQR
jgi:hypothetical protein